MFPVMSANEEGPQRPGVANPSSKTNRTPSISPNTNPLPPSNHVDGEQKRKRQWVLAVFSVTTVLLFADQNLMAPNLTAIAEDFGLDDDERDRKLGGDISLAFFLVGAPASFLVGLLADTGDRAQIFAWTVFIGETACLLTYFAQSYAQLYVCRAVTGFSVGGALPVVYSILGDLFGAEGMCYCIYGFRIRIVLKESRY